MKAILFAVALCVLASCKTADGGIGVIGSVAAHPQDNLVARPSLIVRYDGNTFVAWATGSAYAEVYGKESGFPLYGPVQVTAGTAVVHVRKPEFKWNGKVNDPLPEESRAMFRSGEILSWMLVFEGELPPTGVISGSRIAEEDLDTLHRTDNKGASPTNATGGKP